MPNYVYKCSACSHEFEKRMSIAKKDEVDCQKCGGQVNRMLTAFNIGPGKTPAPAGGTGCFNPRGDSCPAKEGSG